MFKMIKVLNFLNTYSLSILATSMRSARNFLVPVRRALRLM